MVDEAVNRDYSRDPQPGHHVVVPKRMEDNPLRQPPPSLAKVDSPEE